MSATGTVIRIGTRKSKLALAQTELVAALLRQFHPELEAPDAIEIVPISTTGDEVTDRPLYDIGGKGLFIKELEEALLSKSIDLAVHSAKDMESYIIEDLAIACFLEREDPRDAFISSSVANFDALPEGARVGTSSVRRTAQLKHLRPDIEIVPFRGNVQTRLKKLEDGDADATLLAVAGLNRLGMAERITDILSPDVFLPAAGQGAIGIEIRAGDAHTHALLAPLNHPPTELAVRAERAMLATLDGSCRTPIGAYATLDDQTLHLTGALYAEDGSEGVRLSESGSAADPEALGTAVGQALKTMAGHLLP